MVAIVNITRDSFSDGGRFIEPEAAIDHAFGLYDAGADLIELGPASSHPDADSVSASVQIERLAPVLEALSAKGIPVSVDATDPNVLRFAIGAGAAMLNDVRGFPDPDLYPTLAVSDARLVIVHSLLEGERAVRTDATPEAVLESIDRFFPARLDRLVRAGIREDRLIIDPGMGFFLGNRPDSSLEVLRRLPELGIRFGLPTLISVSRKSFLRVITGSGMESIGPATLAAELHAARHGVDYIRTHDVAALRDALEIERRLGGEP
ncbi:MAG TPA: dihydropteroate synthase [Deltaproteobacteria bacterium]|nr:dihydropteroate synthase [Deltaproteobacteria bacterium]